MAKCLFRCETLPAAEAGFTLKTTGPVFVGGKARYGCANDTLVVDTGAEDFLLECLSDGTFGTPTWPGCEPRVDCGAPPDPPGGTNLVLARAIICLRYNHTTTRYHLTQIRDVAKNIFVESFYPTPFE